MATVALLFSCFAASLPGIALLLLALAVYCWRRDQRQDRPAGRPPRPRRSR